MPIFFTMSNSQGHVFIFLRIFWDLLSASKWDKSFIIDYGPVREMFYQGPTQNSLST